MPRVRLLMPLGDFISYIADILAGCSGTVYLQKERGSTYGTALMMPPKQVRVTAET
ncbi:hypothetical protein [uncultured Campylobacter sp.]|uniref:hypothetical protein n=1 Tax=uncultured Campylobacter sp. TaxID=218934 RepID=UPI0026313B42|nr:hypothetical protein [uncultured Campylobacter sp.]